MNMIWKSMLIPSMGYVVGLILDLLFIESHAFMNNVM